MKGPTNRRKDIPSNRDAIVAFIKPMSKGIKGKDEALEYKAEADCKTLR